MTFTPGKNITPLSQLEESYHDIEVYLNAAFNNAGDPIFVKDSDSKFILVNDAFCSMFGLSRSKIIGTTLAETIPLSEMEHFLSVDRLVLREGQEILCEESVSPCGAEPRVVLTKKNRFVDSKGKYFLVGVIHDITERKQAEEKLKLASNVFTHTREGIMITDAEGIIIEINNTFTEINGYSRKEIIGQNLRVLSSGRQTPSLYAEMWQALLEKGHWKGEISNRHKSGEVYIEILNISAVKNADGQVTNYVGLSTDITLMKAQLGELERYAYYDVLTNLPNRVLLADRLSQAMLQCSRHRQSLAVVFLDLDGFKEVNDTYGHDVGDELLIAISQRITKELRENDTLARFGGDEFVAVLADLAKVEDCQPVLERFLLAASEPVTVGDAILNISASIGVTFYPQDNVDAVQLMRHADQTMYVAKESGKNCYRIFNTAQSP